MGRPSHVFVICVIIRLDLCPVHKFQALIVRKGHKRSIVAPGHKMLRTIHAMLSKNTHYVDKTLDYEALMVARNAPRWLQMLVKHGFVPAPA